MKRLAPALFVLISVVYGFGWVGPAAAVDLTGYSPFQAQPSCNSRGTIICTSNIHLHTNKHTVLEFVSFFCELPTGDNINTLVITTEVNGVTANHWLVPELSQTAPDGEDRVSGGQAVRIYADPGTTLSFYVRINQTNNSLDWQCVADLSGEQG
jgi:hypothetical protein